MALVLDVVAAIVFAVAFFAVLLGYINVPKWLYGGLSAILLAAAANFIANTCTHLFGWSNDWVFGTIVIGTTLVFIGMIIHAKRSKRIKTRF